MGKWICGICGYVYDEEKEGKAFAGLPDGWVCPLCGADKSQFAPEKKEEKTAAAPAQEHRDVRIESAIQLSAVCSNLARGCEKQYQEREAALYRELADYFAAAAPEAPDEGLGGLIARLRRDLDAGYPALRESAQAVSDRGTQRICVWGEKVTRMLLSLLERYEREGEDFLKNTQVWICTVCGFLTVGDRPPELCPVCKVPSWKFEAVEGRR